MVISFLNYNSNINIYETIISWNFDTKYLMFTKIFCQMKQNYAENEHFIQQCSVLVQLLTRNFDFWIL